MSQDVYNPSVSDEKSVVRKSRFFWKTRSRTIFYLGKFQRKNVIVGFFVHSWKSCCGKKYFHSKKELGSKFLEKKRFLNLFLNNASCFESRISNESDLEPTFKTRQTLNLKFQNVSDFDKTSLTTDQISKWIWFVKKRFWWIHCLQKTFFWILLARKTLNVCSYLPLLKNHDMEKKWIINSFWMKNVENNQILKQVSTTRQTLHHDFQKISDF